ncbi:Ig family protein (plasmid) [Desulfovibrio ferrophilus]|uniref:Ig family protein n=1 Tax=Desulfovibrio ferrophilus TaxID=241368 RepID=A0A2Z6B4A3_9BACT|nr:Ig family protein [Desulfovibrio ferrophilus]
MGRCRVLILAVVLALGGVVNAHAQDQEIMICTSQGISSDPTKPTLSCTDGAGVVFTESLTDLSFRGYRLITTEYDGARTYYFLGKDR